MENKELENKINGLKESDVFDVTKMFDGKCDVCNKRNRCISVSGKNKNSTICLDCVKLCRDKAKHRVLTDEEIIELRDNTSNTWLSEYYGKFKQNDEYGNRRNNK